MTPKPMPPSTASTADGERSAGARLTALSDGSTYPIPSTGLLIGRGAGCDVMLASPRASRRHARVLSGPDGYSLVDDSTNGVTVNGVRVDRSILLKQGDIIGIGETAFRFSTGAAEGPDRSMFAGTSAPPRKAREPASPTVPTETTPRAKRPDEKPKRS